MQNESISKKKTGLIIGLVAGGLVLAAAAVLFFVLFNKTNPVVGPWHNEELNWQLRFHEDDTVVIRTALGDTEAEYVLDEKDGRGVITVNNSSVQFELKGDSMTVTGEMGTNEFVRGELEIKTVFTEATPQSVSEATPVLPEQTPTAPPATAAPEQTPSTTAAPETTASPEPATPGVTLAPGIILPGVSFEIVPISPVIPDFILTGYTVAGIWIKNEDSSIQYEFFDDNTYIVVKNGEKVMEGPYTYDQATGKGEVTSFFGTTIAFEVQANTLIFENGNEYTRQ